MARRSLAVTFSRPSELVQARPAASAEFAPPRIGGTCASPAPDSEMALTNSPSASGEDISTCTDPAPADSPNRVTFLGSPPNLAMLRWTHCNAAIWSMMP